MHKTIHLRGEIDEGADADFHQAENPGPGDFRLSVPGIFAAEESSGLDGVVPGGRAHPVVNPDAGSS